MTWFTGMKKARIQLGLTQDQMAERLSVSLSSYGAWESGKLMPTATQWPAIEKAMQLRLMLVAVPVQPILTQGAYRFSSSQQHAAREDRTDYETPLDKNWPISRVKMPFK